MDFLFEKNEVKQLLRKSLPYVVFIWLLFVGYLWINKSIIDSNLEGGVFAFQPLRFLAREIAIYGIAWVGYYFVFKNLNKSFRVQYWVYLAILDLFCMSIAFIRYFALDSAFLFKAYDIVMMIITSPLYFVFFLAYSLIIQFGDTKSDEVA